MRDCTLAIVTPEGFPAYEFFGCLETFRHANKIIGYEYFKVTCISDCDELRIATSRYSNAVVQALHERHAFDFAIICGASSDTQRNWSEFSGWLRWQFRHGAKMAAIGDGVFHLARAGLLVGKSCTTHWTRTSELKNYCDPELVQLSVTVCDGMIMTSGAGTAAVDLALRIVADECGEETATFVAEMLNHIRSQSECLQRIPTRIRLGSNSKQLVAAVELMQDTIEHPVSILELADRLLISSRQLERLFKKHLNVSPQSYYRVIRFEEARRLLRETTSNILEISIQTGFASQSHFTAGYRLHFGVVPSKDRHYSTNSNWIESAPSSKKHQNALLAPLS